MRANDLEIAWYVQQLPLLRQRDRYRNTILLAIWRENRRLGSSLVPTGIKCLSPSTSTRTMPKLTALKKKIAALEAQVERITKAELGNSIAKVRKLMADHGVTIEHLVGGAKDVLATASKKSVGVKAAKAAKTSTGRKPAKYADPRSGATWSGLGRTPAWIAKAKNRDAFLIDKPAAANADVVAVETPAAKPATKRAASKAVAKPAKQARAVKSAAPKVAAKKRVAKKVAAAKKDAPTKKATAPAPAATKAAPAKKAVAKPARKKVPTKKTPVQAPVPAATEAPATAG